MCEYGDTVPLVVPIGADGSHTGKFRWAEKPVDRCLAPIVQALNDAGILTESCCCGHGRGFGYIGLRDGRIMRIGMFGDDETPAKPLGRDDG